MTSRISAITFNTFREAVRDRVLYNLIIFAILMMGAALLLGEITVDIERLFLVNMGLTAISIFGVVIAIFIGIGLVSKEIEKRTLYCILSRPVRRWEFIVGKFLGLATTLVVNSAFMAVAFFAALLYLDPLHKLTRADTPLLVALYFIILQFFIVTALALLFSSFSSPILSAVLSFALFIVGSFAADLRGMATMAKGGLRWLIKGVAYIVPNLTSLNVVTSASHGEMVTRAVIVHNTLYAVLYSLVAISAAVLIFERRNFK
jgi:Cu-processing system permease protein